MDENLCIYLSLLRQRLPPISQKCWDCTGYNTHRETGKSLNCKLYTKPEEIREEEKQASRKKFF